MQQRPFNEHLLWKSCIERANYPPPVRKPNMILPRINTLIGGTYREELWEGITEDYAVYSRAYWERVKKGHEIYRAERVGNNLPNERWFY